MAGNPFHSLASKRDVSRASRGATVALTSVAFFMVALDLLVVITALPAMQRDLGASLSLLEWTINAYTLPYAAGIITAAALGDRLGRRRIFVAGLLLFTAASAGAALAPSAGLLIAARAVQGVGAAMVMPLSLTILTAAFPPERRGAIVGIWGGIAGVAVASGPLVGGAVTEGLDWHWIFWLNVPIGIIAAFFARARLAETYGPPTRLDLPGVGLASAGSLGIAWGLVQATEAGWSSPEVIGALALGILLLTGFLAWEGHVSEPMLPLRLFGQPGFAAAGATTFLMIAALSGAAFLVTGYFQFAEGDSPFETGLRLLPWTGTPIVVAPLAGAVSDRIGRRPVMTAGMLLQGAGLAWIAALATGDAAYRDMVPALVTAGVGVSMALPTTATAMVGAASAEDEGKASGVNGTLQRYGSVFGIALVSAVFAVNGDLGTAAGFMAGFPPALAVAAGFSLIGAVSALGVARRGDLEPRRSPEPLGGSPPHASPQSKS
jgi:EmrB/QacA subfamily drug resistance transporter